jgi:uncharacterized membrane protein
MLRLQSRERYGLAALALLVFTMTLYFGVIFPRDAERIFPWSSDAWGHLVKAVYLRDQIGEGHLYPDIFPSWYSGQQILRYFPPLSYYAVVGLNEVTGNIYTAGNLYLFFTSLIGGLSFLLFAPRIGLIWALIGGILFVLFPDNVRVAFAEGNLPRLAATMFLPAAVYFLVNLMERGGNRRDFAGLAVIVALITLSHAMMAGIFLLGLGMYVISHWLVNGDRFKVAAIGAGSLTTGLFISAWWMFASLTGGINELDNAASSEAIAEFPIDVALNPGLRSSDNEIFYVGLSSLLLAIAAAFLWKRLDPWVKALIPVTLAMTLIGSAMFVGIWRVLPAHELFWPLRFMSFAAVCLTLITVIVAREAYRAGAVPERRWLRLAAVAVIALVLVDFQPSIELIRTRERPGPVQQVADDLAQLNGWRVATADLSRLGSAPAMLFTTEGGREQVFGWAFQGSIVAPALARINEALTDDHLAYGVSRLSRMGTDDVVILPSAEISPGLGEALEENGFELRSTEGELQLYHRDGAPRAYSVPLKVLGIGAGANNAALIFPQMVVGSSPLIDDYSLDFLEQFDVIVLSRFETKSRSDAERQVVSLAEQGKRVIIDLTGAPTSPFSRQPKFLGVYGEPILQIEQADLIEDGGVTRLLPFPTEFGDWSSVTPQGAEEDLVMFNYPAATGAAVSRNSYGDGDVIFLGLNLVFHAARTKDEAAIALLERFAGLPANVEPADASVPLANYEAGQDGWRFDISLDSEQWVLFPMAFHNGTRVTVNGHEVEAIGLERLTFARMPAGDLSVHIGSERTGIYLIGYAGTAIGIVALIWYISLGWRRLRPAMAAKTEETAPGERVAA